MRPGGRSDALGDAGAHKLMIRRMKFNDIDTVAETIMAFKYGFVFVGQKTGVHERIARELAESSQIRVSPTTAETAQPVLQRQVGTVQVDTFQVRDLIGNLMGFGIQLGVTRGVHDQAPWRPGRANKKE